MYNVLLEKVHLGRETAWNIGRNKVKLDSKMVQGIKDVEKIFTPLREIDVCWRIKVDE